MSTNFFLKFNPNRIYWFPRPNRWRTGIGAELPEAYKKFWKEWKLESPEPVHYIPKPGRYYRKEETGEVLRVQNVPLPLKYPKELDKGIWGGEAIVQGFVKKAYDRRRVPKFWVPSLKKIVVYSEVLDKYMSTHVTYRALSLIHQHYGLDHYLLKTKACDLRSELTLKLKKKILIALYDKTLYPDDPVKREDVYNRYKHYLDSYTREEIEWYGLTFNEAVLKYMDQKKNEAIEQIKPLKHIYRQKLIEELEMETKAQSEEEKEKRKESWISKLNPFSRTIV